MTIMCLQDKAAEDELKKIPSDLWSVKQFKKEDYWFLETGS